MIISGRTPIANFQWTEGLIKRNKINTEYVTKILFENSRVE